MNIIKNNLNLHPNSASKPKISLRFTGFGCPFAEKILYSRDCFEKSQQTDSDSKVKEFKESGNEFAKHNNYKSAIESYKQALNYAPENEEVLYNIAKVYKSNGDIENSILFYNKLLGLNPENVEALTNLGECYKETQNYNKAEGLFKQALELDCNYDLASRNLKDTKNLTLALINPEYAKIKKVEYAQNNLKSAISLADNYFSPETIEKVGDVAFSFDKTGSMSGFQNIAQYEDCKRQIVVTDKYIWASPEIVASYIVHEIVHARDNDPYTSIKEEQDAYRESVKFWKKNNHGKKDPEMDYATELYISDPEELDKKVAEVYSSRGHLPDYSPNHGISSIGIQSFVMHAKNLYDRIIYGEDNLQKMQVISDTNLYSKLYK